VDDEDISEHREHTLAQEAFVRAVRRFPDWATMSWRHPIVSRLGRSFLALPTLHRRRLSSMAGR
jgi:hypothetical protein